MGMYDSLHTGDRCGQVKCLGKSLSDFVPGDEVTLRRIPDAAELAELGEEPPAPGAGASTEEFSAWAEHPYTKAVYDGVPRPERSWQIPMSDGSYAFFDGGRFVGFVTDGPRRGVPVVDRWGRDLAAGATAGHGTLRSPEGCEVCATVDAARR